MAGLDKRLFRDNGKENGSWFRFRADYREGMMEKNMETTIVFGV